LRLLSGMRLHEPALGSREWIETAQELGRPVREPKGRLLFA
jgi:hypothetical protein